MSISLLIVLISFCLFQEILCQNNSEEQFQETTRNSRIELIDMAKQIFARSGSSSQVLSLNLTNLVILLLLKGLIFGAAYLGTEKLSHKGRSAETSEPELISEQELLLVTSYLMGDTEQDYSCLYRVACQDPYKSKEYIKAAKFLMKGAKMFQDIIPFDNKYEQMVADMQEAADFGVKYDACDKKYICQSESIK